MSNSDHEPVMDIETNTQPHNTKYYLRGKKIDYSHRYGHCNTHIDLLEAPSYQKQFNNIINHAMTKGSS